MFNSTVRPPYSVSSTRSGSLRLLRSSDIEQQFFERWEGILIPVNASNPKTQIVDLWTPSQDRQTEHARPLFNFSYSRARFGLNLSYWSIVFDPRPLRAESSVRPLEMFIPSASSAAVAWIFEAETSATGSAALPSAMPGQKRDQCLEATSPERCYCGNFVGAARQTRKDRCQSRRGRRSFASIRWL